MIDIPYIKNQDYFNSIFYKNENFSKYLNEYNLFVKEDIDSIEKLLKKKYFKVPFRIINQPWGYEKVFYPFSNKLIKVLCTSKGNTSVQLHPLKNEKYLALNDNTYIFNGKNDYHLKYNQFVDIKRNSVHALFKNAKVLEEQDNVLFDNNETIRLYDYLGRNISEKKDYYKFLLPQYRDEYIIYKNPPIYNLERKNKLIFIVDGSVTINLNGKNIELNEKDELYYVEKSVEIIKCNGLVRFIECTFYGIDGDYGEN